MLMSVVSECYIDVKGASVMLFLHTWFVTFGAFLANHFHFC